MRGAAISVGLGSLCLFFACSSGQDAGVGGGRALEESDSARASLEQLWAQFALPQASEVSRFVRRSDAMALPVLRHQASTASVTLPMTAEGEVGIQDRRSGMRIAFALVGARDVPLEVSAGLAWYGRAGPEGADVIHRVDSGGTEDFVFFRERPAEEALTYRVDVRGVAGLRLVANTLEFLDEAGTPRLRVASPWVVDATGRRHSASLHVHGCDVDQDPRAPWGLPITPPGASTCLVRVGWTVAQYPALVDPGWTTTAVMAQARTSHVAASLDNGKAIMVGGFDFSSDLSGCELFDVASATWAATGSLTLARDYATATKLADGRILATGGANSTATAELYDPSTGKWSNTGSMVTGRARHGAARLPDGRVLVAGGYQGSFSNVLSSAEIYNPVSGAWSPTSSASTARREGSLTSLGDGRVVFVGGRNGANTPVAATEVYSPQTGSWTSAPNLVDARYDHAAVTLSNGDVLVIGGAGTNGPLTTVERFLNVSTTWVSGGVMATPHWQPAAAALLDGRVLVAAGMYAVSIPTAASEIWDPATNTWSSAGSLALPRKNHTATLLTSGKVLVAGGDDTLKPMASAELYDPGPLQDGGSGTGGADGSAGTGGAGGSGGSTGGSGGTAGAGGSAGSTGGATGGTSASGGAGTGAMAGSGPLACVPGQTIECACGGGKKGVQACNADGSGYDPCGQCAGGSSSSSDDDGGCGCRAADGGRSRGAVAFAALIVALASRRRRGARLVAAGDRPALQPPLFHRGSTRS